MVSYAGDISAEAAWDILSHEENSVLIDVRTTPEWQFAGVPDLSSMNKQLVKLTWRNYPAYELNGNFASSLNNLELSHDEKIIFMCKLGGRSGDAATLAASLGFNQAYNIKDGLEGPANDAGQRGKISGWKAAGLPWRQD